MLLSVALGVREEERRKANEVIKSWQKGFSLDPINTVFPQYLEFYQRKSNQSEYVPSRVFNTKMTPRFQL